MPCAVGEHADLGGDGAQVGRATAVDADALVDGAGADGGLLDAAGRLLDLLGATGELLAHLLDGGGDGGVGGGVALGLGGDGAGLTEGVADDGLDLVVDVVLVVEDGRERRAG